MFVFLLAQNFEKNFFRKTIFKSIEIFIKFQKLVAFAYAPYEDDQTISNFRQ